MCIYRCIDPALGRLDPHVGKAEEYRHVSHVNSEVVAPCPYTFPPGVHCDSCNASFGKNLEPHLAYHPGIAWDIQRLEVPRKGGKQRKQVANVVRDPEKFTLQVPIVGPTRDGFVRGVPAIKVVHVQDARFNVFRFRRALHMLAFNTLAYCMGADVARHPRYDAVRRYVRWPARRDEEWSFAEVYRAGGHRYRADVYDFSDAGQVISIEVFSYTLYVDLLNRGSLASWLVLQGLSKARLVRPGERYLKSPRPDELPPDEGGTMQVTFN